VAPDPVEEKLPALPVSPENLKGIKVLLVEDNVTNIFIITHYLREWQVDFDVAETGSSALEMIRKARYDLVLLDLQMPVMDGFATIQALRSMEKGAYSLLPVVAVSASANHELEKDLLNAGFQDFLQKPFDPVRLYEILLAAAAGDIIVQKQELDPEKPVSKEIAEKLVDFSELDTFLGGDQLVLRQFIEVLLGDWNKIYEELIQSIADRDIKLFLQARHKTISAAGLLKAVRLQFLLDEMRDFLKDPDNPFPEEEQFEELLDVFRKVMDQLQAFLLDEPV
jgi:CheY-like chemotaxis protein